MKLFLVGVILVCLAGCKDSAMDMIVQDFSRTSAENVARQAAREHGFTDKAKRWGDVKTVKAGSHKVFLRENGSKVRVLVENGKATSVEEVW